MTWCDFKAPPGRESARGSEGGTILLDQEHCDGARITLERDGRSAPFAITCGIYGWMVHTRFFSGEADARQQYAKMRDALDASIALISTYADPPTGSQIGEAARNLGDFVERFP